VWANTIGIVLVALSVAFFGVTAVTGYVLSVRRDLAGGVAAARPGPVTAAPWLRSPLALAFRLQRASIIGWSCALAAAGVLYGWLAGPMVDTFDDVSSEVLLEVLGGGADQLLDGYLGLMGLMMALTVGIFAILGVQGARAEESRGRAEPVLSTGVSRTAWLGTQLVVTAAGSGVLLLVAGLTTGVAAAIRVGDGSLVGPVLAGHVAHLSAVLVVIALAAALFGIVPRALPVIWAVLLHGMIIGFFGPLMDLPQWVANVSPLLHVPEAPGEQLTVAPIAILTVLAVAITAVALFGFHRRDLRSN
jgi:ABC-2 type transport system permease protein